MVLTGSGIKRQTLNSFVLGELHLNHIELATQSFYTFVENGNLDAIQRTTGFVSSLDDGALVRYTPVSNEYLFPTGSSTGITRYRPIEITPSEVGQNKYGTRLANVDASTENYYTSNIQQPIQKVNTLFYHRIYQPEGDTPATIKINYISSEDGSWETSGNWQGDVWIPINNTSSNSSFEFDNIEILNWARFDKDAHVLATETTNCTILLPNAFSPNKDGTNDVLTISNKELDSFEYIKIYNRWGALVFETDDFTNPWDGTYKGQELELGVYVYFLKATCNNQQFTQKGNITIIK